MKRWLKRIRGSLGIGLTWAAVWFGVGAVLELLSGAPINGALLENAFQIAVLGFFNGASFSAVLRLAEGHRTFDEMSLWRFAGWGAVGGLVMSMIAGGTFLVPFMLLGAGCAAGSLALARRADPLLESGEGLGLLEGESPDPSI